MNNARAVAVRGDPNAPRIPLNVRDWPAYRAEEAAYGAQWKNAGPLQYGRPGFVFPQRAAQPAQPAQPAQGAVPMDMDGQGRKKRKTKKTRRSKKRVSKTRKSRRRV